MSDQSIEQFLRLLKKSPSGPVFNPWWQVDEENDGGRTAPGIRREQLRAYLCDRFGQARLAIVGEALGYRGGHFTGIPMTSERIILRRNDNVSIQEKSFFSGITARRTSRRRNCPDGFSEPTATIVWSCLLRLGLSPQQFVLWNAFPWHSFDPRRGMLSNRRPNQRELSAGIPVLEAFLKLFPCDQIVALGRIAVAQFKEQRTEHFSLLHSPSRLRRCQALPPASRQIGTILTWVLDVER